MPSLAPQKTSYFEHQSVIKIDFGSSCLLGVIKIGLLKFLILLCVPISRSSVSSHQSQYYGVKYEWTHSGHFLTKNIVSRVPWVFAIGKTEWKFDISSSKKYWTIR